MCECTHVGACVGVKTNLGIKGIIRRDYPRVNIFPPFSDCNAIAEIAFRRRRDKGTRSREFGRERLLVPLLN